MSFPALTAMADPSPSTIGTSAAKKSSSALFTPLTIANGKHTLKHRIIMSPMTRNRGVPLSKSTPESPNRIWVPDALNAEYSAQRATDGGLIITESILPSLETGAMPGVPGLFVPEHAAGWKLVTEAVHAKGAIIYAQLTHQGRAALPHFTGMPTVSASATPWSTDEKYAYPPPGTKDRVMYKSFPPVEISICRLQKIIAEHVSAAKMAFEFGFDGVEVHGGNGYLVEQFLSSNVNKRTDGYGGSSEKRCRFALELIEALVKEVGVGNVALRLSPFGIYNDMNDENRWETWGYLCREVRRRWEELSYMHFVEPRMDELKGNGLFERSWGVDRGREVGLGVFKEILAGIPVISAGGWGGDSCWGVVEEGKVDACVFARWFVSNADLVERLRYGRPLNQYDRKTFYGPSWWPSKRREDGYTDYPTWEALEKENTERINHN